MRALIVSLALAVVVVACMAFVVLFAGLRVGSAALASIGLGIFMVGALFAAVAALGPKSRPTPLLTPTIAGTTAAVLTTVVLITGGAQLGNAYRSAMRASEPAKVAAPAPEVTTPEATAPTPEVATPAPREASGPEPIQFPEPAEPLLGSAPATPAAAVPPATMADLPSDAAAEPATGPQSDVADTVAEEPAAESNPEVSTTEATAQEPETTTAAPSASSTTSPIPIPPIPPPPPARQDLSQLPFDTSNPPPLPNAQAAATPPSTNGEVSVNPPLPRSRPCGAGGPPCP